MPKSERNKTFGGQEWLCPWCGHSAQLSTPHRLICSSKTCECGAIALGALRRDFDEVVDDAINIFGIDARYMTPFDSDRLAGLSERGIEMLEGAMVAHASGLKLGVQYFWFRKRASEL